MPSHTRHKGGKKRLSVAGRLEQRRKEFDSLSSDKKDGRRRPGSMSGRK